MRSKIDNKTFQEAYENLDNLRIMASAVRTSGTTCILSPDELESCKLMALWNTLRKWSAKKYPAVKFTTFLFKNVRWQCYLQAHTITKYQHKHQPLEDHTYDVSNKETKEYISLESQLAIDEALEALPKKTLNIIQQRFYDGMTFKQIGDANGYSHETARSRVDKAVDSIKKLYL